MKGRLPIIVGVGALVLAVLVYLVLVQPKKAQVSKAKADFATAQQEQATLELQLEQLQALKQNAQETRRQLDKIATEIPPTADEPGLIRLMQLAGDKAGVDLTVQSTSPPTADAGFSTMSVGLTVTGDFFQVDQFLYQLENLPRAMKVTTLSINPAEYPVLTAAVSAQAYTTDVDSGPGSTVGHQSAVAEAAG